MDSGQTDNFTGKIAGLVPGAPGANFGIRVNYMEISVEKFKTVIR